MDTHFASKTHYKAKERTNYYTSLGSSSSGEKVMLWRGLWDPEQRAQLIHAQLLTTSNSEIRNTKFTDSRISWKKLAWEAKFKIGKFLDDLMSQMGSWSLVHYI